MVEPARLSQVRLGEAPIWAPEPTNRTPPQVALEYLQNVIVERLKASDVTPEILRDRLGGTASTWKMKLAGSRRLTLEDLLALLMGQDAAIGGLPALNPSTVKDLIPEPYWKWLSHTALDNGLPKFRPPDHRDEWLGLALEVDDWWRDERMAGREWAIAPDVLVHRILTAVVAVQLHAASGVADSADDSVRAIEWVAADTRLHIHWPTDVSQPTTALQMRTAIGAVADQLWRNAESASATKVHVVAAPRQIRETLYEVIAADRASTDRDWLTLSLGQAHRLGLDSSQPDIQVQVLFRSREAPLDWYLLK